jgi:hypothetical protein
VNMIHHTQFTGILVGVGGGGTIEDLCHQLELAIGEDRFGHCFIQILVEQVSGTVLKSFGDIERKGLDR